MSLQTDQDENLEDTTSRVTLMTVHAAKGLEFPVVFIVGMEENLFPSQFCEKPQEIEEERRLLYVAITRAMERCYLTYARQRFRNGQMAFNSPSRFLRDIDKQFFELSRSVVTSQPSFRDSVIPVFRNTDHRSPVRQVSPDSRSPIVNKQTPITAEWKEGDRVSHKVFGIGTVNRVYRDEVTENDKIEIRFDTQGVKTLLLSHARLEKA